MAMQINGRVVDNTSQGRRCGRFRQRRSCSWAATAYLNIGLLGSALWKFFR